jgi:phosphopentomutase
MDSSEDLLFVTSDHGNIEDISIKTHTKNPVPTILYGNIPERASIAVKSLTDIVPLVMKLLAGNDSKK